MESYSGELGRSIVRKCQIDVSIDSNLQALDISSMSVG